MSRDLNPPGEGEQAGRRAVRVPQVARAVVPTNLQSEVSLHEIWQILQRRRWTFILCFAAVTIGAILFSLVLPTRYEGVSRLTVDFDSSETMDLRGMARTAGGSAPETKLQTQVSVLQTDALAWDVIKRLHLDQHEERIGLKRDCRIPANDPDNASPDCRRRLLDEFHSLLHVQSVPRTEIIEIRYRSKSPELAARTVNSLTDAYVQRNFQTKYQASMRVSSWLSGQLDDVKHNAELAEEKFLDYQKKTGVIGVDESHNVLIERLNAVNQQLVVAEANRIVREARYRVAANGDPEALAEITNGSPLQIVHAEEAALEEQYAQLNAKYGENYPRVIQVKAQLDKAQQTMKLEVERVREKTKSEYQAALSSEAMLRREFEEQKQQAYDTNEAAIQVALLKRDVDASRELYEQLSKKLNEAGILAGLKATNVTVIDPATVPAHPVEPHHATNLGLGLLAGSMLGVLLCFVTENVDTTIGTATDLTNIGTMSSLGLVPRIAERTLLARIGTPSGQSGRPRVIALEEPEGEVADAYRSLRTSLLLSNPGAPPKVVLITSPLPREGKTTTSINTAVVFAQKNRRVLLVDGDLRRADMVRCFDFPNNGGLSAALVGDDPNLYYIRHPKMTGLTILPAGDRPPQPPDLLDSDRMRELVALWRENFDHVIIDAPPILGMSDSVILATMADTVVLVARAQHSRRTDLFRAQEVLASVDAHIGGVLINDLQLNGLFPMGYEPNLYAAYYRRPIKGGRNAQGKA